MYEGVFGLSSFSEISLDKLSSIVDQARHTQKLLDLNIEDYFKPGSPVEPVVKIESLAHVSRPEFFQAIKKSLTKYIKAGTQKLTEKYARTIEELALDREKNGGGMEWLQGMMENLEKIIIKLYHYIRLVESTFKWEFCTLPACSSRKSHDAFRKDVFTCLISASDIVRRVMKEAMQKREISHPFTRLQLQRWDQGQAMAEIELQMEESCQQLHGKQKKKKKKKKNKVAVQNEGEPEGVQISDDERELTSFLSSLSIQDWERSRVVVAEEWIASIAPSSFFKK